MPFSAVIPWVRGLPLELVCRSVTSWEGKRGLFPSEENVSPVTSPVSYFAVWQLHKDPGPLLPGLDTKGRSVQSSGLPTECSLLRTVKLSPTDRVLPCSVNP